MRKTLSCVLASTMLFGLLAGCGNPKPAPTEGASTQGAASGTVKMLSNVTGGKDEAEMKLFAEALGKATGLEIEIEKPASDFDNILIQKLQGGEEYDLIYLTHGNYLKIANQGALMDITDRVQASEIFKNNVDPQEWKDITVDGKVYGGFNKMEVERVVLLNKTHLEAVGIDYKTIEPTLDGYYNTFKALRAANPDKDYYPFSCVLSEAFDLQPWFASVGLHDGVITDESDGKTFADYSTDEAAPVWEWLKKLYDEKLMDPASFVDQTKDMRGKIGAASQKMSVCVDWATKVGQNNSTAAAGGVEESAYRIVSLPGVKAPAGSDREYMLVKGAASLFGIPANAPNPDGAFKVLEYFATQEGGELLTLGVEGHDYTKEGTTYQHTDIGAQHANDHGAPYPIYKDFVNPMGSGRGMDESLSYLQYAEINTPLADEKAFKLTVGKWGIEMLKGNVSIEKGLASMRDELVMQEITEK